MHAHQSAARREDAHGAIDKVFHNIKQKIALLEDKRRRQGELFAKIKEERMLVLKERKVTEESKQQLEQSKQWLEDALASKWMEDAAEDTQGKRVCLNVGGQMFETTLNVLQREPESRLARVGQRFAAQVDEALASARAAASAAGTTTPPRDASTALVPALPLGAGGAGVGPAAGVEAPFFDRDWWLFRYILQCMREGPAALPQDRPLLKQLFSEAGYWRLTDLQEHIRTLYMRIAAREAEGEASLGPAEPTAYGGGASAMLASTLAATAPAPQLSQPPQQQFPPIAGTAQWAGHAPGGAGGPPGAAGATWGSWAPVAVPQPGALRPGAGGPGVPPGGALPSPAPGASQPYWNYSQSQPWPASTPGAASSGLAAKAALVGYAPPTPASAYAAAAVATPTPGAWGTGPAAWPRPPVAGAGAAAAGLAASQGWPSGSVAPAAAGYGGWVSNPSVHASNQSATL